MSLSSAVIARLIVGVARLLTGVQGRWIGCAPALTQRVYFANHSSHADFVLIWAVLPHAARAQTRPVAGADYWEKGRLKSFIINQVFRAVLIDRERTTRNEDPIEKILAAMAEGASVILFPEGTRNTTDEPLLPLKSGLYHLARRYQGAEWVPVWIENLGRVLPKGEFLPIPLLCTVNFGQPLVLAPGEDKAAFLERARRALLALAKRVQPA
jgi:1-acyl-sn-glycerol-3-phosphate acyltransferase